MLNRRGEAALKAAPFTGTVSFGFAFSGNAVSIVRKEILLVRHLMSIWHWPNSLTQSFTCGDLSFPTGSILILCLFAFVFPKAPKP